jgi:hypothetical protein
LKQPYRKDQQRFLNCFPLQAIILGITDTNWQGVKIGWIFWGWKGKVENFGVFTFVQFWVRLDSPYMSLPICPLFSALFLFLPYQFDSQVCYWSLSKLALLNDLFLYGITVCFLISLKSLIESIQNIIISEVHSFKLLGRGK